MEAITDTLFERNLRDIHMYMSKELVVEDELYKLHLSEKLFNNCQIPMEVLTGEKLMQK